MPNWRRAGIPGGKHFFTVVTDQRVPFLCDEPARRILGTALRECRQNWPFEIDAIALLPDHLHTIWTLPAGDAGYSMRWAWIKKEFTKEWLREGGTEHIPTAGRRRDGRRGVWQPKFWEHAVRAENDFESHADYIHYNSVKHGLVRAPADWPWSSFHRWVRDGFYPLEWGRSGEDDIRMFRLRSLRQTVGE
jgi:putative transposase